MRDGRERLMDILEAIERIQKYTARGEKAFRSDELIQNWVTSNIQVIGEAARGLSEGFRDQTPEIPWSDIIGMRHVLVHEYFDIDLDIVWRVATEDLPRLREQIRALLATG
jgi:uncharacterized protein with HEPN domain